MAYLPTFEHDIFISYAHADNDPLTLGQRGWIDEFHHTLQVRLNMVLGAKADVWRDPVPGHELFAESLPVKVRGSAILVSIVSPTYIQSWWCLKELEVFKESADVTGGLLVGDRSRIFKVIKLPVDSPEPVPALQGTDGFQFYEVDREGFAHELDPEMGAEARRSFRIRVDDVAYHIRDLLKHFRGEPVVLPPARPSRVVYLAETPWELREQRDLVRRELRQRGFRVLPEEPLPHTPELRDLVRDLLRQSELSVHLVGSTYGVVPEEETSSIAAIQYKVAGERIGAGGMQRIVWIAGGASPSDERQKQFLVELRTGSAAQERTEILDGVGVEGLKTTINDILKRSSPQSPPPPPPGVQTDPVVYLICDPVDIDPCLSIRDYLMAKGAEVVLPLMEGDEAQVREDHQENLKVCDAALVFWGRAGEAWVRTQLREIQKAPGYGRAGPIQLQGLYLDAPDAPAKERFRTRQAMVMREEGPFDSSLRLFLDQLPRLLSPR